MKEKNKKNHLPRKDTEFHGRKNSMELCIREVDDCGVGTFRHSRVGGNPEIQAGKKRLDPRIREVDDYGGALFPSFPRRRESRNTGS